MLWENVLEKFLRSMRQSNSFYDTIDHIITYGVHKGILHLYNDDERFSGNTISLKGRNVVNFGSCSYLGLEFDKRLKDAAKDAIDRYGTQFSESRAYVSIKLYRELENLFEQIFGAPCVVTPTTTLGHIANIPVLIEERDAVIMDQQVHHSVQTAVAIIKSRNVYVDLLRHNRMDLLEEKIKVLRSKYKKIWYLADGIYSMYGDGSPVDEVYGLMNLYPELYYYVDDAHGMSIFGENGRGYVLDGRAMHHKMVMATSLAKAFATGGAVMVYPNAELARKVRTCGGPLITSGPMQPAALGAATAAAKIHLSSEIYELQEDLRAKTNYARRMLKKYRLPLISDSDAGVFFVGVSLPKLGYKIIEEMMQAGYYLNLGIFPAVPIKNTGIRFTITRLHSLLQIEAMISSLAEIFFKTLKKESVTIENIYKAFKIPPEEKSPDKQVNAVIRQSLQLTLFHYASIVEIKQSEWDQIFENKGTFDWNGLKVLEGCFSNNKLPEDNWLFDYLIIKDNEGKIIVASFVTTGLWKDDMLSPGSVSRELEEKRLTDPYFLTTKTISTGSLLTEGEHLYINKNSCLWKDAMQLFFDKLTFLQEKYKANSIVIRDFHGIDEAFDGYMVDNGFFRIQMPDTHIKESLKWNDDREFYESLSRRSRQHFREDVKKYENVYEVSIPETSSKEEIDSYYQLYLNVKNHSYDLNTFTLPKKIFYHLLSNSRWEVIVLKIKKEYDSQYSNEAVCSVLCYKTEYVYIPMIIGLNYTHNKEFKVYRQALYQIIKRARNLNKEKILFGFAAEIEKKKFGAKSIPVYAYMQIFDGYNTEVLQGANRHMNSLQQV